MYHTTLLILEPKFRFWRAEFFGIEIELYAIRLCNWYFLKKFKILIIWKNQTDYSEKILLKIKIELKISDF
jgi:hypothetical protein